MPLDAKCSRCRRHDSLSGSRMKNGDDSFASGSSHFRLLALLSWMFLVSGCAVHYYSKATGTEHLWGFGHLKMRAVPQNNNLLPVTNAAVAYVTGVRTLGLNLGAGEDYTGASAGWDSRSRVVIKQGDASFYLLWPANTIRLPRDLQNLFTVRIGTNCPFYLQADEHARVNPARKP